MSVALRCNAYAPDRMRMILSGWMQAISLLVVMTRSRVCLSWSVPHAMPAPFPSATFCTNTYSVHPVCEPCPILADVAEVMYGQDSFGKVQRTSCSQADAHGFIVANMLYAVFMLWKS